MVGSRPMVVTHALTIRAYCLVDKCSEACKRLGNKKSSLRRRLAHPRFQNRSGLFSDFKLHWVLSFLLHHDGP